MILTRTTEIDHVATGAVMRRMRLEAGKTIKDISFFTGYSEPYLSQLETGRKRWTQEKVNMYHEAIK